MAEFVIFRCHIQFIGPLYSWQHFCYTVALHIQVTELQNKLHLILQEVHFNVRAVLLLDNIDTAWLTGLDN